MIELPQLYHWKGYGRACFEGSRFGVFKGNHMETADVGGGSPYC